jgi:hypothetical protein
MRIGYRLLLLFVVRSTGDADHNAWPLFINSSAIYQLPSEVVHP